MNDLTIDIVVQGSTVTVVGPQTVALDLTMPGIQGPTGPTGPTGPQGPPGQAGATQEQKFTFAAPVTVWLATHTIPVTPGVHTYDTSGVPVEGDVTFPTPSTVRVEWAWPMAGTLVVTT